MTGDTHYDVEILAELAEGLLDDTTAWRIRQHLAVCDPCGESLADLAAVREILAAMPVPAMPLGVAMRIDRALAEQTPDWDRMMRDAPWENAPWEDASAAGLLEEDALREADRLLASDRLRDSERLFDADRILDGERRVNGEPILDADPSLNGDRPLEGVRLLAVDGGDGAVPTAEPAAEPVASPRAESAPEPALEPVAARLGVVTDDGTIVPKDKTGASTRTAHGKASRRRLWAMPASIAAAAAVIAGAAGVAANLLSPAGPAGSYVASGDATTPAKTQQKATAASYSIFASGHNYTSRELRGPLLGYFGVVPGMGTNDDEGLNSCVKRLSARLDRTPIGVDKALYNGNEAMIMAFWEDKKINAVRVVVVDSSCHTLRQDGLATWK